MNSIWKLLISDEKQTLDENFNYILEVLIESLESKSLRIRETSCLAITEFLKSFEAMRFLETFLKLWTSSFHLLDDVDSSVRLCALGFGQQLIKISEKLVKNSTSFDAEKSNFIDEFFTLILERGASHSAKEVQSVSLQCVLTLTKDGSAGLEKYLPKIIGLLLESIDASESQELSYAMNHAEALNTSKEHIENLKIMLAESSPLSKSIDNCLQVLKGNQVQDLTGKLTNSFRYGIGITGIYKAASVVRFLAGKYPQALSSCCKELLNASKTFLFHESKALRKVSASTLALLCSISDKKNLLTVLDSLFHNYLTSDSKNSEFTVGQICLEIVKSCRDRFDTYMEKIIPFSYIASCDFREDISSIWSDVWNEVSAGQRDIELYLSQILVQCKLIVAQGSYNMREVSASALSKLYKNAQSLEILTSNSCEQLEALIDGFGRADRTGKDRTYTALVEICKRCSVSVSPNKELLGRIMKSLIEDCSNHSNFIEGLQSLCQLLSVFTQLRSEYSASILAMIETGILKNLPLSSESKDQDLASGAIKDCVRLYECVEKIWPNHIDSADSAFQKENLDPLLSHCISGLFGNHPSVRLQALKSLSHIVSLLPQNYSSFDHALYDKAVNAILNMTEDMKNGSIRAAAFSALQIFLENQTNLFGNYVSSLKAKVLASENDSNPAVSMIVRKLKNLL
jgi:proteasome component ECM29